MIVFSRRTIGFIRQYARLGCYSLENKINSHVTSEVLYDQLLDCLTGSVHSWRVES